MRPTEHEENMTLEIRVIAWRTVAIVALSGLVGVCAVLWGAGGELRGLERRLAEAEKAVLEAKSEKTDAYKARGGVLTGPDVQTPAPKSEKDTGAFSLPIYLGPDYHQKNGRGKK